MLSGPEKVQRWTRVVLGVSMIGTLALLLWAGLENASEGRWVTLVVFMAWGVLPYTVLFRMSRWAKLNARRVRVIYVGTVLIALAGLFVYWSAFVIAPDAQSGVAVVFMPFYQLMATAAVWLVAFLWGGRVKE